MCQINYTTENKKNKPLNQIEMGKIETMLNEGYNSTQIAKAIERDSSCIQKEIKKFSIIVKINKKCDVCKKYEEDGKEYIGECGLFKGLSADDRDNYEEKLQWVCDNIIWRYCSSC